MSVITADLGAMQFFLMWIVVLVIVVVLLSLLIIPRRKRVIRAGTLLKKARHQPLSQADMSEIETLFNHKAYRLPERFMPIYYQWMRKIYLAGFAVFGASVLYMLIVLNIPPVLFDSYSDGSTSINTDAVIYFAKFMAYYIISAELYALSLRSLMRFYHATYKELLSDNKHFT